MTEQWLTLNQAAEQLGIHPDTLRRWADGGKIAFFRTPGGHRRFSEAEINSFGRQRLRFQIEEGMREVLSRRAIKHTREELESRPSEPWLADLSEQQKVASRELGHRLMGLAVDYLTADDGREALEDARRLGRLYGAEGKALKLPLDYMMSASIFFRDALVETIVELPHENGGTGLTSRLLLRMNEIIDAVQLEVVKEYGSP